MEPNTNVIHFPVTLLVGGLSWRLRELGILFTEKPTAPGLSRAKKAANGHRREGNLILGMIGPYSVRAAYKCLSASLHTLWQIRPRVTRND